ncbi:MAG: SAM-dependent chlorinase/fluorinase [Bacteroidales bacterium]|nr:SAM-dependent chlorinase/fluorinase [Bacteroidales bacterium]
MSTIVTLTTDWGQSDYYIGAVKAAILSKVPNTVFVDISHNIESFSIAQAAFVLKSSYHQFPSGTIHIVGVDSEPDKHGNILVIPYLNQYFILNDNGIAGLLFGNEPTPAIIIKTGFAFEGSSFTELNIFSNIAIIILKNGDIENLGEKSTNYKRFPELLPNLETNTINGEIIYIDSYGNAVSNINKELFDTNIEDTKYEILINSNLYKTKNIYKAYKEVEKGDIVCIFNSLALLEVAIREGSASQLLSLKRKSEIRIKYKL